jgi:hypothetical protein
MFLSLFFSELFQADIVMDDYVRDVFNGEAGKRDAVSLASYHWPARTIHYKFDPDIGNMRKRLTFNIHWYIPFI